MFVAAEIRLGVSYLAARAGLAALPRGGWLTSASADAYAELGAGLARVGPVSRIPGLSKLVEVRVREPVTRDQHTVLTMRWQATGPADGMFPVMDTDITLRPAQDGGSALELRGSYRPPLGALGAGLDRVILHTIAAATVRKLMTSIGDTLTAGPQPARPAAPAPARAWSWLREPGQLLPAPCGCQK